LSLQLQERELTALRVVLEVMGQVAQGLMLEVLVAQVAQPVQAAWLLPEDWLDTMLMLQTL
jgi:hypothetical protein